MKPDRIIKWGILATGWIAHKFASDLKLLPNAKIIAVGSRNRESADSFGNEFDIPYRFGSYEELAACPEVDIVYIGTPHPFHRDNTIMCLQAGKAVLCEKPFAINAREAQAMIAVARSKKLFLMEAMWSRFTPMFQKVKEWLSDDLIGDIRLLQSDYGFQSDHGPESRVFNPDLGGGALLDVGVYPVSLSFFVFNRQPDQIKTCGYLGTIGVDEQGAMIFDYRGNKTAMLFTSNTLDTKKESIIFGTRGSIHIYGPWWQLRKLGLTINGMTSDKKFPLTGSGYAHQAIEAMNCLRDGKLESNIMPLQETIAIMETLDRIRAQWGLKYPME